MARGGRRLLDPLSDPVNVSAMRGGAQQDEDDFDASEPEEEDGYDGEDGSAEGLNDPDVSTLAAPPKIGGGYGARGRRSEMFGEEADHALGRASSPRLYAQASQFPTCVQLRVWKWENGVPVGLGTIDATSTEEDFVRKFFTAMPRRGEGRAQYRLRPIDIRGQELGQEVTTVISEHHAAIRQMREAEEEEREMRMYGRGRFRGEDDDRNGGPPQVIVEAPQSSDSGEQMSHVVDRMLEVVEARAKALEDSLDMERERLREEESRRAQERIDLATNAAQGVQVITDRLMKDEAQRAERALRAQQEQSQMVLTTITTQFQQSQQMAAQMAEERRRQDEYRLEQERQRSERERRDVEERLRREREEYETKRTREREEAEIRLRAERDEAQRKFEQQKMELEMRLQREREELERKEKREKEDREARERWFAEERARREEREGREAKEREEARLRREMLEREYLERKEKSERDDRERRDAIMREELRLREAERERKERLEKEEKERREMLLKEELRERESERQRQHELRVKEMEAAAARDREHAERMASMARLELEAKASASGNDTLGNTMKLFSQFGIPPEEVFPRMFGMKPTGGGEDEEGEEKSPGWMAALPVALGALGEVAKAMAARNAGGQPPTPRQMPQQQQQMPRQMQQQMPRTLPPPPPQQQFMPSPQRSPQAQRPLPPRPQQARPQPVPSGVEAPQMREEAPPVEEPIPFDPMVEASAPEPQVEVAPEPVEAPKPNLSQMASEAGMSPKAQKSARVSLRALIKKIAGSEESEWEELIGTAILKEINIYYYVKAVTVKAAMLECGAGEELAGRVIVAMRASSSVPSDLPYGDGGEA